MENGAQGLNGMVTPEAVVLDLPIASAGVRVIARAIDMVISLFGAFLVLVGVAVLGNETVLIVVGAAIGFAVLLGYPVLMEAFWGGRTLGKAMMKLRVVRADGAPIGLTQATARGALGLIDVWFTLGFVGLVSMLVSKRSQRLGDLVGDTLVLRRSRSSVRAVLPVHFAVPPGCEELVRLMDIGAMTPADYELVRSFLIRWHEFNAAQRPAVAATVAAPLWKRFRHPLPGWLGPDYYLACLGAAYQIHHPYNQPPVAPPSGPGAPVGAGWGAVPGWGAASNWGAAQSSGSSRPTGNPAEGP
ncbi:MAG TPA: RDD family protein, partial [Acidimicrobiales bacterium]|nr:RDD family protein [Acidimicrobiales bacterium]